MRKLTNVLVTGGAGFIGSAFIRYLLTKAPGFHGRIINLDSLTYAGSLLNLADVKTTHGKEKGRYTFINGDITNRRLLTSLFAEYDIDTVVNFAAESHVDRSIAAPEAFIRTNTLGTFTLLETARAAWQPAQGRAREDTLFHQISTDEVYGSLPAEGFFTEETAYNPRSPYSASKAAADHLAMAWFHTYGLPVTVSNGSNNYGPYQFPEKFIPLMILNLLEGKPLPLHGDGKHVREWIFVEDHNEAVWTILRSAEAGGQFNIGSGNERENISLLETLIALTAAKTGLNPEAATRTIVHVKDRPGADKRYAMDSSKIKALGWKPRTNLEEGLANTVDWYLANPQWVKAARSHTALSGQAYSGLKAPK